MNTLRWLTFDGFHRCDPFSAGSGSSGKRHLHRYCNFAESLVETLKLSFRDSCGSPASFPDAFLTVIKQKSTP
jgi:hypothetical protein